MKKDWKSFCKGCGECCGPVPINKEIFEKNKDKIEDFDSLQILVNDEDYWIACRSDLTCSFYNKKKGCLIYEDRPNVCKLYGNIPELKCSKL